jgi:hypothetical protein
MLQIKLAPDPGDPWVPGFARWRAALPLHGWRSCFQGRITHLCPQRVVRPRRLRQAVDHMLHQSARRAARRYAGRATRRAATLCSCRRRCPRAGQVARGAERARGAGARARHDCERAVSAGAAWRVGPWSAAGGRLPTAACSLILEAQQDVRGHVRGAAGQLPGSGGQGGRLRRARCSQHERRRRCCKACERPRRDVGRTLLHSFSLTKSPHWVSTQRPGK